MEKYIAHYTILASDMDITYHITPNAILLYFQDSFAKFLSSKGLAAFDIVKDNLIWVIHDFDVTLVRQRPLWADDIKVEIWFSQISSIKMYVNFRIYNGQNESFAEGTSCWVIINGTTKRPFAPTELLTNAGIDSINEPVTETKVPDLHQKEFTRFVEHKVNVTDLDFNGHVCNRSYLSLAMGTCPLEFIKQYAPQQIHIQFVREAFIEDTLKCNIYTLPDQPNAFLHNIVNSNGKDICNIYTCWKDNDEGTVDDVALNVKRDR